MEVPVTNVNKRGRNNYYFAIMKNVIAEPVLLGNKPKEIQKMCLCGRVWFRMPKLNLIFPLGILA